MPLSLARLRVNALFPFCRPRAGGSLYEAVAQHAMRSMPWGELCVREETARFLFKVRGLVMSHD